ncbi:MAG: transposase, partial [Bacilli bacterium]
ITREEDEEKLQKTALALALEKGKELGLKEEKLIIAKAMLIKNINIQTIKECTGLSDNEINNLK